MGLLRATARHGPGAHQLQRPTTNRSQKFQGALGSVKPTSWLFSAWNSLPRNSQIISCHLTQDWRQVRYQTFEPRLPPYWLNKIIFNLHNVIDINRIFFIHFSVIVILEVYSTIHAKRTQQISTEANLRESTRPSLRRRLFAGCNQSQSVGRNFFRSRKRRLGTRRFLEWFRIAQPVFFIDPSD
jgi:hypothetical protein